MTESTVQRSGFANYAMLCKPRMTALIVVAAAAGFYLAHDGSPWADALPRVLAMSIGTALLAIGAGTFNQIIERRWDARMRRTADRPIPTGRMSIAAAIRFGLATAAIGLTTLAIGASPVSAAVGLASLILYVAAYTPLKRVTPWSVIVGAVPGALPVVIGWTAAAGSLTPRAWLLFGIVFVWQIPHFLAIAWLYRDDYAAAGFAVLPVIEPTGRRTVIQAILFSLALIPVSLLPTFFGLVGYVYYVGALVLGFVMLGFALEVARLRTHASARQLLLASLVYLPTLLILMTVDKIQA
ncbi:MAG: protoheme IX farnesyltransferase [Phycisphaerales bacterium]|nr:protoheme IX farnesyltransferase [Phycisphaerales bacterium]